MSIALTRQSVHVWSLRRRWTKRGMDIIAGLILLLAALPLMLGIYLIGLVKFGTSPLFSQVRVGQFNRPLRIYKFRSLAGNAHFENMDSQVSLYGRWLRNSKLDELPQLVQVVLGQMSLVGPRPDVFGFQDELVGKEADIALIKPGLTCAASIKYRDEHLLIERSKNPVQFNKLLIYPDKVRLNLEYLEQQSLTTDTKLLLKTIGWISR